MNKLNTMHVFMHIPKCGGLTIRQYYLEHFKKCLVVATKDFFAHDFIIYRGIQKHDAIIGHLPMQMLMRNREIWGADALVIHSVIRDPLDRIISQFNYLKNNTQHPWHDSIKDTDGREYVFAFASNYQTKYLSWRSECETPEAIAERTNIISLDRSNQAMNDYFVTQLKAKRNSAAGVRNITQQRFSVSGKSLLTRDDFTVDEIAELESRHAADMALHEKSKTQYGTVSMALRA